MSDMCFNDTEYSPFEPQHEFMSDGFSHKVCDECANGHISEYVTNWSN